MNKPLTLGSLFDGSGGFPLAGLLAGIVPVWSSEIEPFAIRVTEKRLPQVQHFGNISGLHGAKLPPVDIITFGSPCQDMSIAGKRTGLNGSRSSLFHEAIRIIREMRCASNGKYPRYIVWENVPGAFSSNGGEDFRCVLEAICSVKDSSISIPRPAGKWTKAGEILAESYSLAWRVLDAQYWGVPQRRKRIFLVADFDGTSAGKILFESEGLSGYSAESLHQSNITQNPTTLWVALPLRFGCNIKTKEPENFMFSGFFVLYCHIIIVFKSFKSIQHSIVHHFVRTIFIIFEYRIA